MDVKSTAALAFRQGRFSACHDLLSSVSKRSDSDEVLAVEVLSLLGKTDEAEEAAERLVHSNALDATLLARSTQFLRTAAGIEVNWAQR